MSPIELQPEIQLGFNLSMTRERLGEGFRNPALNTVGYEAMVADYVNAFHDYHFSPDQPSRFATYGDTAKAVKMEIELLADEATSTVADIETKLLEYCQDERGNWLLQNGYPQLPRAVMHTLIDLIDSHRPVYYSRLRQKVY
jgi:hypothetical protein